MAEEWKDIEGYEGIYQVSNRGRVRSLDRVDARGWNRTGKTMKLPLSSGYPSVNLCKNGVQSFSQVYVLVAEAFIGPRPDGYEISHKDNTRTNGHVDNLEYVTHRENVINSAKEAKFGHVLSVEEVQELREFVTENPRSRIDELIERFGADRSVIYDILSCRGYAHVPNRDGSEAKPIKRMPTAEDIMEMRKKGMSIPEIANELNLSRTAPYTILNRAGVYLRGKRPKLNRTKLTVEKIREMQASGMNLSQISEKFGYSDSVARCTLYRARKRQKGN